MNNLLLVIDMQNDFIDGSLGTNEAKLIVSNVVDKIKNFQGNVVFTRDTHTNEYLNTMEGKNLPVLHCVKDTAGWQLNNKIEEIAKERKSLIIDKPSFGSLELVNEIKKLQNEAFDKIELIGLCTDICVISNALILKAAFPECDIVVDSSCCAGVTKESHQNALEAMKMCQVTVI
ncbi:cysteine hydrolase family protein [Clostridium sp. Marseille-P299]|uniref:cysteine hydrolase family protein n=1 Tax=Clostridium sp. Marseille-P299 TaxID=1805477 RepID=UPI00082F0C8A|nr:isochorismatase family cysteine hydrolase [Clostridium sp. Marseille-P299]